MIGRVLRAGAPLLLLAACSVSGPVRDAAVNVVTLQQGTVQSLRERTGTGPTRVYDVPPDVLLRVVAEASARARSADGRPVRSITVSERYREVVAKERDAEHARDEGYAAPFVSAMLATVSPVAGAPGRSRLEVHATDRGPFHGGTIDWETALPGWIDEVLRERAPPRP